MKRESVIYKARRKMQAIAYRLLPNAWLSRVYFKLVLGKRLNLKNPTTFNEKVQWMKLYAYPKMPLVVKCTDKYAVRDHLNSLGLSGITVPLLGAWDDARKINWDELPDRFVLKCNHGCAYNLLVPNKNIIDKKHIVKMLNGWLREDFGAFNVEIHYSKIKPRMIICEEFLGETITDYKFFCFAGKPEFMYVSNDLIHDREAKIGFFNIDGSKIPLKRDDYDDISSVDLPAFFSQMCDDARKLSEGFPFVRVDFFIANGRYYFAELTFTPGAGMMPLNPEHYDVDWGKMIDISNMI